MIMVILFLVGMGMDRLICTVGVRMRVNMCMFMGMDQFSVGMLVGMGVDMFMGVLKCDCILNHQHRRCHHNGKSQVELQSRPFFQQHHTEKNT